MQLPNNLPAPDKLSKSEIIDILLKEEYGYLPPAADTVSAREEYTDNSFCAGNAVLKKIILTCVINSDKFEFPIYYAYPTANKPVPCFIHINFRDNVPDKYMPSEEIIDSGYAVISFCYTDITSDDGNFSKGLAGVIYKDGKRKKDRCGKIGLWAWAVMRVMDYAITLPELDKKYICVAGHSRLGKTSLLAGALDERFYCAFSNDSGACGAAILRGKRGENIRAIYERFPYWFCENFEKYIDKEDMLPFDQHFLIAANFPHKVYVSSASQDIWADPDYEYLSCVTAGSYFEKSGQKGFIRPDRMPETGDFFSDGDIGYHLRNGVHYFSRTDWQYYIKFLNKHISNCKIL